MIAVATASFIELRVRSRNHRTIIFCSCYHRLRGSGGTVVTMTRKVSGKTEVLTPVNLKPPKILKQNSEWMITLQPCHFLWKSVQGGLLPI